MDRDVVAKSLEKLASQGAAQFDMGGNVRGTGAGGWQAGYERQVQFRREQIERMMQFAETQQCRMTALIRHFGDTADAVKPCGVCDFCAPSGAAAQSFAEPDAAQERQLRTILKALDGSTGKSTGKLHTDLALTGDRKVFDALLDGLARAGLVGFTTDSFTKPDGQTIAYKKVSLTYEGQTLPPGAELGVMLRGDAGGTADGQRVKTRPARKDRRAASAGLQADFTPTEQALEEKLRAWRKAEAAKTGKPAFMVFGDTALAAVVRAAPRSLPELLQVGGFGPDKVDRYGAAITALCRDEDVALEAPAAAAGSKAAMRKSTVARPAPAREVVGSAVRVEGASGFAAVPEHARGPVVEAESLDEEQQALEQRLRRWRQAESERMGLPQFFVLGTSTLRSIVVERPRTMTELAAIAGLGQEKMERFGSSILAVCNG